MIKIKRIALAIFILVLIAGFLAAATWSWRVYTEAKRLRSFSDEIRELQSQGMQIENIPKAIDLAERISFAIDDLKQVVGPILPLLQKMENIDGIGPYLRMVQPGMDYASNLSNAVVVLGQTFLPLIQDDTLDSVSESPTILSNFLSNNQLNFTIAERFLLDAIANREQIDAQLIPENYRDELLRVDTYLSEIPLLFRTLHAAPLVLGSDKPITYLFLVQNKDEIRASGGYVTAFGLLRLRDGRILGLKFEDSTSDKYNYVSDLREPPYPLKEIMFAQYLVPRDANWSPDFPSAAQQTQDVYFLSTQFATDAVIAFDQKLIVDLLELTGPLNLPNEEKPISAENVEAKMIEYKQIAIDEGNSEERKEFLSTMAPYLIQKLLKISSQKDFINLGKLLIGAIQSGHLSVYFNNQEIQDILFQMHLDGAIHAGDGDFLMVVDSNVGFNKVDQFIDRSIKYLVDLEDPADPKGEIRLRYEHTQPGSEPCLQGISDYSYYKNDPDHKSYYFSRCYWNYWRVLTASGTSLNNAIFTPIPREYFREGIEWDNDVYFGPGEKGTNVGAGLSVVPQLEVREITLETNLPSSVIKEDSKGNLIYSLRIQKQAGIISLPVEIEVMIPLGYTLKDLPPDWVKNSDQNKLIWSGEVIKTVDFQIEFER